ncbi:hypothetical protein CHS0354_019861 [Potamilus streckersoni]|uniref:Uncharacterized protein n=1 Tax=Potamilus streckersoni TaxID=2493646 RepID=A0AAE0S3H6_9BIVA|nr:hypothetical protein CHS0354_019861 [Potamilus streckersoni]
MSRLTACGIIARDIDAFMRHLPPSIQMPVQDETDVGKNNKRSFGVNFGFPFFYVIRVDAKSVA